MEFLTAPAKMPSISRYCPCPEASICQDLVSIAPNFGVPSANASRQRDCEPPFSFRILLLSSLKLECRAVGMSALVVVGMPIVFVVSGYELNLILRYKQKLIT